MNSLSNWFLNNSKILKKKRKKNLDFFFRLSNSKSPPPSPQPLPNLRRNKIISLSPSSKIDLKFEYVDCFHTWRIILRWKTKFFYNRIHMKILQLLINYFITNPILKSIFCYASIAEMIPTYLRQLVSHFVRNRADETCLKQVVHSYLVPFIPWSVRQSDHCFLFLISF